MEWTKEPVHVNIVAILLGISGLIWIFLGFGITFFGPLITQLIEENGELRSNELWVLEFLNVGIAVIGVVFIVTAVLAIVSAILVYNRKVFGYYLAIVLSVFRIFNFPIGTAISIYTILVLVNQPEINKGAVTDGL